jgi:succinate dehydrogenase / fumarate reductase cytochrome b subunit
MGGPVFAHEQALWIARLVLLACVVLHIVAATQLTLMSRAARPIPYSTRQHLEATYASRTMRWGGVIIGLFVVYHLLHFTFGAVGYAPGQFKPLSVYRNVVLGFSVWYVSAFYVVAQLTLGLHLYHGVWSLFQTLGVENIRASRFYRGFAGVLAVAVVGGNISLPLAVLAGLVR